MKMNPKVAKTPDDLKKLEFKKMKALVKKDLARLEKNTTAEKPTQIMITGDFAYTDKPKGIGMMLLGAWKGPFKTYAKEQVAKGDDLGAIGQAYYGGVNEDGQKVIRIDLAKGKAKAKSEKLKKGLRKLVPQSTFSLVFSEIAEDSVEKMEKLMDAEPEVEEVFEEPDPADEGQVDDVTDNEILQKLLDFNLAKLSASLQTITKEVHPRLKARTPQEEDPDWVTDTLDLANEWMELYQESPDEVRTVPKNALGWAKVQNIIAQVSPMLALLTEIGVQPSKTASEPIATGTEPEQTPPTGGWHPNTDSVTLPHTGKSAKIQLNAKTQKVLKHFLAKAGITTAQISSTWRTPNDQARIMFDNGYGKTGGGKNLKAVYDSFLTMYANKTAVTALADIMTAGLKAGKDHATIQAGMEKYISELVAKGIVLSRHLSGKAVDVNPDEGLRKKFEALLNAEGKALGITKILSKGQAGEPTTHIEFSHPVCDGVGGGGSSMDTTIPVATTITTTIQNGSKGAEAILVQNLLLKAGESLGKYGADGDFGKTSETALKSFQAKHNLPEDGKVAPDSPTWLALNGKTVTPETTPNTNTTPDTTPANGAQYSATQKAMDIGKELAKNPMYQNGYAGPEGFWVASDPSRPDYRDKQIKPGEKIPAQYITAQVKSPTWCNAYARDVVTAAIGKENNPLGAEFEAWMSVKHHAAGKLGSAGAMQEYFVDKTGELVDEIPIAQIEKAWDHINAGKIVFFSHPSHIAIGAPSTPEPWKLSTGKTINIGKIIQAGVEMADIGKAVSMKYGFPEERLPKLKIFVSKKNGEQTAAPAAIKPEQVKFQYKGGATPIPAKAEAILRDILAKAGEGEAVITTTLRSAQQQASVMYMNLESAGVKTNRKMYKDKTAAGKVIDAYETAKAAGKTKEQIVGAMLAVGGFDKISEHCDSTNPAIDIHPSSIKNKSNFEAIIKADARLSVICPPKDTTYHIKVK